MTVYILLILMGIGLFISLKYISKKPARRLLLVGLTIFVAFFFQACSDEDTTNYSGGQSGDVTKTQYEAAKKEHKNLVATNDQLTETLKKTNAQRQQLEQQQGDTSNQTDEQNQSQDQTSSNEQPATSNSSDQSNQSADEMVNGNSSSLIIGNINSHVYHMPGQRGYTMKAKNAVYFHSEQEAINAGYRKAQK